MHVDLAISLYYTDLLFCNMQCMFVHNNFLLKSKLEKNDYKLLKYWVNLFILIIYCIRIIPM